jgi:hypothetical protein
MSRDRTEDRDLTLRLAAAAGVAVDEARLAPLFDLAPDLTEWSINPAADRRGTLRVSTWTRDRAAGAAQLARLAPELAAVRARLVGDDHEGLGLALRAGGPPSARWWALATDGEAMAARAGAAWPEHAGELDRLLAAAGGPWTCVGAGVEGERRQTIYAELRRPDAALRVLELARVEVSRAANLFWKGLLGLEPGGRPWPKVWVGRSLGDGGGWKFYYFARGDELRRTDRVLLAAIAAGPELEAAWQLLRSVAPGPWVQLVGLTIPDGGEPSFTAYLARS